MSCWEWSLLSFRGVKLSSSYAENGSTGQMIWKALLGFDMGFNDTNLVTIEEEKNLVYLVEDTFGGNGKLFALDKSMGEVVLYKSKATDDVEFMGDYVLLNAGKIDARAKVPAEHYFTDEKIVRIDPST